MLLQYNLHENDKYLTQGKALILFLNLFVLKELEKVATKFK